MSDNADVEAIRKWAKHEPSWAEQNQNTMFDQPSCYMCGEPTVTYVNPAADASATYGPTRFYPVCEKHAPKPWDMQSTGKAYARRLLSELDQALAERDRLRELLERLYDWDHMGSAGDGPFWRNQIDQALGRSAVELRGD